MLAKEFYGNVSSMRLLTTCGSSSAENNERMYNKTVKADWRKVRKLLRKHCPEYLWLMWRNPYRFHTVRKEKMIIVVHSAIDYFFILNDNGENEIFD